MTKKYKLNLPMEEIKERYLKYESCSQIAKSYRVTKDTILQRLRDMDVAIRKAGDVGFGKSRVVKDKYPKCECCDKKSVKKTNCGRYFCQKHYYMFNTYGDPNHISYYDLRNKINYKDNNIAILEAYNQDGTVSGLFTVDTFNLEKVLKYKWRMSEDGYLSRNNDGLGYNFSLHRYLTNFMYDIVDHIDRDPTNNVESNFRCATNQQNSYNQSISKNNASGVTGVHWDSSRNKWKSTIKVNYQNKAVRFSKFDDAVKHRLIFESMHAKEFSPNYNKFTNTIQLSYISHDDNLQTFIEVSMDGDVLRVEKQ